MPNPEDKLPEGTLIGTADDGTPIYQKADESAFEAWLRTRPPAIQEAGRKWPLNSCTKHQGELLYLIGYNERDGGGVMLIFSRFNPREDYAKATAAENRLYICAEHMSATPASPADSSNSPH